MQMQMNTCDGPHLWDIVGAGAQKMRCPARVDHRRCRCQTKNMRLPARVDHRCCRCRRKHTMARILYGSPFRSSWTIVDEDAQKMKWPANVDHRRCRCPTYAMAGMCGTSSVPVSAKTCGAYVGHRRCRCR